MTKDGEWVWSAVAGPLPSEMYCYAFLVDGVKTLDPSNMRLRRDVLQVDNLVFAPGPAASLYSVNRTPHGTVSAVWYPMPSLNKTRRMYVYTPPGYEEIRGRYPVLYLLHGAGGDETEWLNSGRTAQIMDNLIAEGKARPMIVVMPNGHASQEAAPDYADEPNPPQTGGGDARAAAMMDFPDSLTADIVPFVEKNYRALADRENRAVAGLSMGGAQAAYAGLRNLDKFAWVASFSGAFVIWQPGRGGAGQSSGAPAAENSAVFGRMFPNLDAGANARLRLLYFSCGLDDFLLEINREFKNWLKGKGLRFVDLETPHYAHVWSYWRKSLADIAPRLFQPAAK
jgi:enterochelin esterase family protein